MADGYGDLTEKEKETLRLMVRGHDAKSAAAQLALSVHTINERLRAARRKLGVTSSREAARVVFEREGGDLGHQKSAPKDLGEAGLPDHSDDKGAAPGTPARRAIIAGALIMLTILAAGLILASQPSNGVHQEPAASAQASEKESSSAARTWLELVDASDWQRSFDAAGQTFRNANTVAGWAEASRQVRGPLGAVLSRELRSDRYVNAPPAGFREVAFTTQFAAKADAVETVTLVLEDGIWKPVGIMLD